MKFYVSNQEIIRLLQLDEQSCKTSVFTSLLGRRRTGKTTLVRHAFHDKQLLYFFVSSKTEAMICKEFQQSIESGLGLHIYGQVDKFSTLLCELMVYSEQHHLTLMIDEFQRLYDINLAIMSEIQDDTQFSGLMLERYFRQMYAEKERTTEVGRWWNTRSEDEIDMIAIQRLDKHVTIAEVKRNVGKINLEETKERFANIRSHFRGYEVNFIAWSMDNM